MRLQSILRSALALALAAPLFTSPPLPAAAKPSAAALIRVLTCNVRLSTAKDGDNAWARRRDSLASLIASFPDGNGPYDFIGTQETILNPDPELNQRDFLAAKLPGYGLVGRSRDKTPERGEAMILFWKKDRWQLDPKDNGTFWLSDTPDAPGSKAGGAAYPRTAVFGLFHETGSGGAPTGRKVYVYDTHLDHVGEIARQRGAKALLAHIAARAEQSAPVILMGDFNCVADSPAVRYILGEKTRLDGDVVQSPVALADTFSVASFDDRQRGTTNSFKAPGSRKIDFIFASPALRPVFSQIIRTLRPDGGYPTDHFPVEAVLSWK
jgi:endonuclease/exonuclease/phosphatase family metal-dependent hydrolase